MIKNKDIFCGVMIAVLSCVITASLVTDHYRKHHKHVHVMHVHNPMSTHGDGHYVLNTGFTNSN